MINKVLVANRGEIACRVMRTARKMGIKTVAVYSDIDKDTLFVEMADEAYNIGPAPALESYLRSDKIIDVALSTKSQAIHPGFGFLSENASFSEDCEKNGLLFVGPPPDAIRKMGSKSQSKIIMTEANVPVVPGYHGENQEDKFLQEQADKITYPVLIKAVMGGGGKGMRIVHRRQDFKQALDSAKSEALNSFNDDRVLVEKYIQKPRHIEVQIFGDKHGNYVHLFERDCSIQRRHQKVVEEAPSAVSELIRQDLGDKAKAAAKAVQYTNAGTVEFIFDLESQKFYFMEMNTRLQVEHPITEMITGVDLVEWQLRVASGEKLPLRQEEIKRKGHSIEARIYSEFPQNSFLPGSGKLNYYREPQGDVRIESGVRQNDQISIFYDPMIAKLVVWGENRQLAIQKLNNALENYLIAGLPNNIDFLKQILKHKNYQTQDYDTSFIEKNSQDLLKLKQNYKNIDVALALVGKHVSTSVQIPFSLQNFWNNNCLTTNYKVQLQSPSYQNEQTVELVHSISQGIHTIQIGNETIKVNQIKQNGDQFVFTTTKGIYTRRITDQLVIFDQEGDPIQLIVNSEEIKKAEKRQISSKEIVSTIACTLNKLFVTVGQEVKKGDILVIVWSMKMEHTIKASMDGKVKEVRYKNGEFIDPDSLIILLE